MERVNYTDLRPVYFAKLVVLVFVAFVAIIVSKGEIISMAISAFTFLTAIFFDCLIVALSNNGPRKKVYRIITWMFLGVVFVAIFALLLLFVFLMTGNELNAIWLKRIKELIYGFIVFSAILGPMLELVHNRPKDD